MKRRVKKKIAVWGCILFVGIMSLNAPVYAKMEIDTNHAVVYQADKKEWHYKIMNGKWYKRLYNVTQKKYETGWIPA